MSALIKITRTVEFAETDMAGIMHFSNFFRWMEACETAFYRSLDLPLISFTPGRVVGWPRVRAACEFHAPLRYGDTAEVRLAVKELRTRAVVYSITFHKLVRGRPQARPAARGEVTAVCVTSDPKTGAMTAVPFPRRVRTRLLRAAPPDRAG